MGIQSLGKIAGSWIKSTKSITNLEELASRGIQFPSSVVRAEIITASRKNNPNETMEVIRFFDKHKSVGSITNKSNGESFVININHSPLGKLSSQSEPQSKLAKDMIYDDWYRFKSKMITKEKFKGKELTDVNTTFVTTAEHEMEPNRVKPISVLQIKRQKGKEEDLISTTFREHSSDKRTSTKELSILTSLNKNNALSVKSMTHTPNVNVDKTNEYLYSFTLPADDFAKAEYAKIVQRENMKGIVPDINLNAHIWYSETFGQEAAGELIGTAHAFIMPSKAFIGINTLTNAHNKASITNHVNHECQHLLVQHRNIFRTIGDNARNKIDWNDPRAKKFYDGIQERFGKITPESKEYTEAQKFIEADKNYKLHTEDRKANAENYLEIDAERAGNSAVKRFQNAVENVQNNFPLLKLPTENQGHLLYREFQEKIKLT